jgi:hypothetical protein
MLKRSGTTLRKIFRGLLHVHRLGRDIEHHGSFDFVGVRALMLGRHRLLILFARFENIGESQNDSFRGENLGRQPIRVHA